jgi:hypothetical protein
MSDDPLTASTPCSQSQIGQDRYLRRRWMPQVATGVVLSVAVRSGPGQDRCEWHASGTAGQDDDARTWP